MNRDTASKPYHNIQEASHITGLSQFYLRNGCKRGTIPHIRCGNSYKINVPALLEQLDNESRKGGAM